MAEGTCSVEGCDSPVRTKGFCNKHYQRWWKRGTTDPRPPHVPRLCSVDECGQRGDKGGVCGMHAMRLRRHGSYDLPVRPERTHKTCCGCGETKPLADFYYSKPRRQYAHKCKPCWRVMTEARRRARRDDDLARKRQYYHERREYFLRLGHKRYWDDPDKARRQKREDHARHREERIKINRAWKEANPERFREAQLRGTRKRRAILKGARAVHITAAQLAAKVAYWGDRCWMCGSEWEHIDHVKPVSKGGAHMLANLRPACQSCNQTKKAQWPYPTARRRPA